MMKHIFSVSVGVVYSPKAGAQCTSRSFLPHILRSQFPRGEEGFSKYVANLPHEKKKKKKNEANKGEVCVGVCVGVWVCVGVCVC